MSDWDPGFPVPYPDDGTGTGGGDVEESDAAISEGDAATLAAAQAYADSAVSEGDDATLAAAAAYADGLAAGKASLRLTFNAQTGTSYTPALSDEGKMVTLSNAGAISVSLPQDSEVAHPIGSQINFSWIGVGQPTFSAGTGATANGTPGLKLRAQWSTATAIKRAANAWLVVGDLAA